MSIYRPHFVCCRVPKDPLSLLHSNQTLRRTIKIDQVLPYPPEAVWRALTEANILSQWFMKNDLVPLANHEFTFQMAPQKGWDGITHCKIIDIEPLKSITYTYRGEATGEKALACAGLHSEVANRATKGIFARLDTILHFAIEPTCGGTLLHLKHSGYQGLKMVLISWIMQLGWKKQLGKKLPLVLAKIN